MNLRLSDLKVWHLLATLLAAGLITCAVFGGIHIVGQERQSKRADDCVLTYAAQPAAQGACERGDINPLPNP